MKHTLANRDDTAALLGRGERLQPDTPRQWGRMTAHKAVCHMADSFKTVVGLRPAVPASSLLQRTLVRFIALHTPLQWPRGVPPPPEVDKKKRAPRPVEFARDKQELRTLIER